MAEVLKCDCGFEARAERPDGLVAEVQRHAWEAHGMALSHEEAVLVAFGRRPDAEPPPTIARRTATRTDEEEL